MRVLIVVSAVACALVTIVPAAADLRNPAAVATAKENALTTVQNIIVQFKDVAVYIDDILAGRVLDDQCENASDQCEDASDLFQDASDLAQDISDLFQDISAIYEQFGLQDDASEMRNAAAEYRAASAQYQTDRGQIQVGGAHFRDLNTRLKDLCAHVKHARDTFRDCATIMLENFELAQNTVNAAHVRDILNPRTADKTIATLEKGLNSEEVKGCDDADTLIIKLAKWHFEEERYDFIQQCRYLGSYMYDLIVKNE